MATARSRHLTGISGETVCPFPSVPPASFCCEEGGPHLSRPHTGPLVVPAAQEAEGAPLGEEGLWTGLRRSGGAGFAGSPTVRIGVLPEGAEETEDAVGAEESDIVVCHGEDERETGACEAAR